jgi:hypothetical protein
MKNYCDSIIRLKEKDLNFRIHLLQENLLSEDYNAEMEKIHIDNARKLKHIIKEIGFPSIPKVGQDAYDAAWLIIQHAISLPIFMKSCLRLMKKEKKDINPVHIAYLEDRICFFENKPQLYGSQFDWDENGVLCPHKYDDLDKVNERRHKLGLNSLQQQTLHLQNLAIVENEIAPTDWLQKQVLFNEWRKKTGWIKHS